MNYATRTDPYDDCAAGSKHLTAQAVMPGKVKVRGFSRQDGKTVVTPSYTVTVTK